MSRNTTTPFIISEPKEVEIGDTLSGPLFGRLRKALGDGQDENLTSILPPASLIKQETVPLQPVSLDLSV